MGWTIRAGGMRKGLWPTAARVAAAEWGPLFGIVRSHVRRRRLLSVPLATAATLLVLTFSVVQHLPGDEDGVRSANCLSKKENPDRAGDGGEVARDDLAVLFGKQRHG